MLSGSVTSRAAKNARNRGGAIMLPMVRGFAMSRERNKRMAFVQ